MLHAHEYVFHHGAHGFVHEGRDGNHAVGFRQLQFEFVVKLDGVPVRLHVDRDVGIVGINLLGAPGDQVFQQRVGSFGNVGAADMNDLALALSHGFLVGQMRHVRVHVRVSLAQAHDALENEEDFCARGVVGVREHDVVRFKQVLVQFVHHPVNVKRQERVYVYFRIHRLELNQIHVVGFVAA